MVAAQPNQTVRPQQAQGPDEVPERERRSVVAFGNDGGAEPAHARAGGYLRHWAAAAAAGAVAALRLAFSGAAAVGSGWPSHAN